MLHSTFPRTHHKYLSMPLLGRVADGFDNWLAGNGYTRSSRKHAIQKLRHIDVDLRRRRIDEVAKLTHAILDGCWRELNKWSVHIHGELLLRTQWLGECAKIVFKLRVLRNREI